MSAFGEWTTVEGLPAFEYRAGPRPWDPIIDPPTSRHWVHLGNRRITLVADSDGLTGVWDEHLGCRWLAERTGVARFGALATDSAAVKLFGPAFCRTAVASDSVGIERTVLCPEGAVPWVLIKVDVLNRGAEVVRGALTEEWDVRPRLVDLEFGPVRGDAPLDPPVVALENFGGGRAETTAGLLAVEAGLELAQGERATAWFRFGLLDGPADPEAVYSTSLAGLRARLPSVTVPHKQPWTQLFRPSDQNLWALWLAAEYVDREVMIEHGESVLNSAMAAWVLPVYASLAERLGDAATASEARQRAAGFRELVAGEWNGRWFRRAHGPGGKVVGDHDLWLELQPWAILCGATADQARALLRTIDETCRAGSPLGARHRWPVPEGAQGQVWASVNMTLIWAASPHDPDLAWDEWRRMTCTRTPSPTRRYGRAPCPAYLRLLGVPRFGERA